MSDAPVAPDPGALRRAVLAVCVLDDIDLEPYDGGVVLRGGPPLTVTWLELRRALGGAGLTDEVGRARVGDYLRGRRLLADTDPMALRGAARPVGLPVDHPLHPGLAWVRERVLGDVLDLGLGFVGVGDDPDAVVVIPQECIDEAAVPGLAVGTLWQQARDYLDRMAAVAIPRVCGPTRSTDLRPVGDCDVVTLLGSSLLRSALAAVDGTGMRAVAAPMRRRGWLDLSRIDPAFTVAAAAAADVRDRGFSRPLLVTADEVTIAPAGGRPAEIVLRDPAAAEPALAPRRWVGTT